MQVFASQCQLPTVGAGPGFFLLGFGLGSVFGAFGLGWLPTLSLDRICSVDFEIYPLDNLIGVWKRGNLSTSLCQLPPHSRRWQIRLSLKGGCLGMTERSFPVEAYLCRDAIVRNLCRTSVSCKVCASPRTPFLEYRFPT